MMEWLNRLLFFGIVLCPLYDSENKRMSALKDSTPLADLGSSFLV